MSGKEFPELPESAADYGPADWLVYGEESEPNTRSKLLALTVEEMVKHGPSKFSVKNVCDRIEAKYGLINYYFESKEKLIAEASAMSYRKSVNACRVRILEAPKDAEKRLRAHLLGEFEWFKHMNSWGILVGYPVLSPESRELVEVNFGKSLEKYFEYYLCIVGTLILDLRKGTLSNFDFDVNSYPKSFLLTHPKLVLDGVSFAWSAHGLNVWSAGRQLGSANLSTRDFTQKMAINHHIDRLVALAKDK